MSKQGKSRKPLIIGIIAAVVILAALLAVLLTNCVGQGGNEATTESTSNEVPTYQLYWNVDKAEYSGKSEAGLSSREPDEDGMFSVRFILDGEMITLRVANRRLINTIDVHDVMGLEFDDKGVVVGVLSLDDMPLEKVGWQFFVQSTASKIIKLNSSESMNGMEVMLEGVDPNRVWDMSGKSGEVGCVAKAMELDKVMAVQNLAGEVTHVFIYERPNFMLTHEGYCEHCKQDVTWKEWVRADKAPNTAGHYQLHTDIAANAQVKIAEDAKLCLDLNGHRIDGKANLGRVYSMFNPGISFAIMDTSEEQTGTIAANGKGDQGMCVWVRYGALYLYGGTLDGSNAVSAKSGVAVAVAGGQFFYMYGGKIIGGTATWSRNEETGKYTGAHGGALSVGGKFVMHDGIIENGKGDPYIEMKNGSPTYTYGAGGNMYVSGVFEMHGGIIRNGRTANAAGNICVAGSGEVTMNGGTISGGTVTGKGRNGGSVYISGSKAVFNMNGGSIVGGSSKNAGGVVYCNGTFNMRGGSISGGKIYNYTTGKLNENSANFNFFLVNGTLNMSGGKIAGGVQAIDTSATDKLQATVNLSGSAKIQGVEGVRNLTISAGGHGVKVKVGTMSKSAKVGIYTTIGVFSEPTKAANVDKFFSDIEGAEVILYNDRLALGAAYCLCGASKGNDTALDQLTHKAGCSWKTEGDLLWQPYTGENITKDCNVYLTKDMEVAQRTIGIAEKKDAETGEITQAAEGNKLNFDLNGFTLSAAKVNTRVFYVMKDSSLTITDSGKGGTVKGLGHEKQSGVILMGADSAVTLIDGTITMDKDGSVSSGGISQIPASGTFTMYNGTISNGTALSNGGIFDVCGKLYVYDGVITGGKAIGQGGNIYAREKSQVVLSGNTQITNGECVPAEEGKARSNGGNISVAGRSTVTIRDNALISGGLANNGGNIAVYSHLIVEGGTVKDGICKNASGSITSSAGMNIVGVSGNAHIDIRGGKIAGGVYVNCYGGGEPKVSLSGAPVVDKALTSNGVRKPAYSLDYRNIKAIADPEVKIDASGLTKGAKIGIMAYSHFGTKANTTVRDYFFSEVKNTGIALIDGGLYLGEAYCLCGASKGNDTALKDLTHKLGCTWETEGDLLWQPYTGGNILKDGNYFLADTITTNQAVMGQAEEKKDGEITKEAISVKVNLDLNGQTWKPAGRAMYVLNESVLTITDSGEDGTIIGGGHTSQSGTILTGGKAIINLIDGEVTLAEGGTTSRGGIMEITGNVTFNMYGGKITNGVTIGNGGNLNVKGTFNMYGGEISGGKSNGTGGNINIEGTGKVLITGNAKVFDGECVIVDGAARKNGGNICLSGDLTIGGNAEIYGGTANNGGNMAVFGRAIIKDSAKIYDGITTNASNAATPGAGMNIVATHGTADLDIRGGIIAGGVYINCYGSGQPQVSLSGAPVIDKELTSDGVREPDYSLDYSNRKESKDPDNKIDVSGLTDGAWIGITAYDHFAVNANATIKKYFFADNGVDVSLMGTDLRLGTFYCLCGASKGNDTALDQLTHKPGCTWETEGELLWKPFPSGDHTASGNYYLTGPTGPVAMINIKNNADIVLDLNDYTLTANGRAFRVFESADLTITDSGTNGQITAGGVGSQSGMILIGGLVTGGDRPSVTLIDGTLTLAAGKSAGTNGGIISIAGDSDMYMYGGEITGGTAGRKGGNVHVGGVFEMYGGTISGGTAGEKDGNVHVEGTFKMSGGTIVGGLYVNSNNVTLSGNTLSINKGTSTQLYSMYVETGKTVDVKDLASGATVKVTSDSGNAFAKNATEAHLAFIKQEDGSDVILDEGFLYTSLHANITGCVCGMPNGAHLSYNADGTTVKCDEQVLTWKPWTSKTSLPTDADNYYLINDVNLSAQTTISAGVKIDLHGKTITSTGTSSALKIASGEVVITNTVPTTGGILNKNTFTFCEVANGATLTLYHVDVNMESEATTNGGLFVVSGTMNIMGDTVIRNGKVASNMNTGNIKISKSGTLNMYSGIVKDGRGGSGKNCGNIQVEGTLNLYGGTITGGKKGEDTPIANGNIWASSPDNGHANLNLFGGTVDGDIALYYNAAKNQTCPVVTLKGGITINMGNSCGLPFYKDNAIKIAGALTGTVNVTFSQSTAPTDGNPVAVAEGENYTVTAADAEKLVSTNGYAASLGTDGKVYMGLVAKRTSCICGQDPHVTDCTTTPYEWTPWTKSDSLPTDTDNYYLTKDVTLTAAQAAVKGADIKLDLNGKTITVPGSVSMYTVAENDGTKILVTDTTAEAKGSIEYTGAITAGVLELPAGNTGELFRGKVVLDDTVTFDSFISTGVVSADNAAKITTKNGVQNVYVFPEELANASSEEDRLYIGKIGCICGNTHNTDSLVCDGSVHVWTMTTSRQTNNNKANYQYLSAPVTVTGATDLTSADTKIHLDMNGFDINANGGRYYRINGGNATVVFTNTSSKTATINVNNSGDQGRVVWAFTNGGVVRAYNVNVHVSSSASTTKTITGYAFSFANDSANGIFQKVNFTMAEGNKSVDANGMFVSTSGTANATLKDCEMSGAYGLSGAAICMSNTSSVKLIDTKIKDNTAATNGGGVYITNTAATLTVAGSTEITGNELAAGTVNNLIMGEAANLVVENTTEKPFTGKISLAGAAKVTLIDGMSKSHDLVKNGNIVLDDSTNYQWRDYADGLGMDDAALLLGCECGGKAVGMTGHTCVDIEWTEWTSDNSLPNTTGNYILTKPITATGQVSLSSGKTVRVDLNGKNIHMDYTSGDRLDSFRTYRVDKGAVLTVTDSTTTPGTFTVEIPEVGDPTTVSGKTQADADAAWSAGNFGMLLWIYGGDATIYDGVFDGSNLNGKKDGMPIYMYYSEEGIGSLTIYGGTFNGATTTTNGGIIRATRGSTLNIKGGTFNGGNVGGSGGAIYADGASAAKVTQVNISGGTITGGVAKGYGGNLVVGNYANLKLTGGTISNGGLSKGAAGYGGNIKVLANGTMEMSGGTVKGGFIYKDDAMTQQNTSWRHSQVSSEGSFTMSGGRIEGSAYVTAGTANISGGAYVVGGCHLSVEPAANITIGALTDKASIKFFIQENATDDTKSEYKTKWSEGAVSFAAAGSEFTEAMLDKLSVGTYPVKTGRSFKAVLENGELFFRMITNP